MGQRCYAIALKEYRLELRVQRYLELYSQELTTARHASPSSAALLVKELVRSGDSYLRHTVQRISIDEGVSQVWVPY
jgi:hypothetical protein